jgi:hypothetical protein
MLYLAAPIKLRHPIAAYRDLRRNADEFANVDFD